ncbi:MAG: homocysteine S-methyltransferase family protein, partial [Bacteriovoracia bacterium]
MTMIRDDRSRLLRKLLQERILILDGAMGTMLQRAKLTAQDFGGEKLEGCNENLVLTRPELIKNIHRAYYEAGADIVETNSFGGTPFVLDEYGLGNKCHEINFQAAKLACEVARDLTTEDRPRFVAGSIGPTTKALSVTGGIGFDELSENFYQQAKGLYEGGVDYFLIETCQDTLNIKAALLGIDRLWQEGLKPIPCAVSVTIESTGTMLGGQNIEALSISLEHIDLLYLGLNCATGPEFMTDHIRSIASISNVSVGCVPNAGLPDEDGNYLESPKDVAKVLKHFADEGWINLVGGCCGTSPDYTKALAETLSSVKVSPRNTSQKSRLSGMEMLEIEEEGRPYLVGERSNVIGSKKFRELIAAKKFHEAADVAKEQVKNGAHIVDICLANPDGNEIEDMKNMLEAISGTIKVPLMIDTTDPNVVELALRYCQGKVIINSINLEDGVERFEKIVPLGNKFGAAFVVGTIDEDPEQGMAVTLERKMEVARRSYELLVNKYGVKPQDIYWDPLVFPCATGDQKYAGSAVETIKALEQLKIEFPACQSVLGISNVSFGLPPAGREVLNSVFLHHCTKAGLSTAIVNTAKLKRFSSLTHEEIKLCEDLLHNRGEDPIAVFANHFRNKKVEEDVSKTNLSLEERLAAYIIEGKRTGLEEDIKLALEKYSPLEVINGPLMDGMKEVGRLFNDNQLIVAEVLQSAEVMKKAVSTLEPYMEAQDQENKAVFLLATVKGDVHDIGKNLVDIVLSNNGYKVINLGIKIPSEKLIEAYHQHKPDMIGLSGLLVKSAQQMISVAQDFKQAGIKVPLLAGGAALTRKFVD